MDVENPKNSLEAKKGGNPQKNQAFQILHRLRRICAHPSLIKAKKPNHKLLKNVKNIEDYKNSGKLIAVRDLLNTLGFQQVSRGGGPQQSHQEMDA